MLRHRWTDHAGFDARPHPGAGMRGTMAHPELVAMLLLAMSTAVVVTIVSIEIAQAKTFPLVGGTEDGRLALATFLAVLMAVMGGITALVARRYPRRQ